MDKGLKFLSGLVFARTYAAKKPNGYKETWEEAVQRVIGMHCAKFPHLEAEIRATVEKPMLEKWVVPSMRTLQFAGGGVERENFRAFNCSYLSIKSFSSFAELFYILMNGTGVGYSVKAHHVAQLPKIPDKGKFKVFRIPDSKEGWADSVLKLFKNPWQVFDYSALRPAGSPLSTGGTASGPEALMKLHEKVGRILLGALGRQLTPMEASDIVCHIADGVVVGGVRRAALICLFDTVEMLAYKSGDWWEKNPQRARANISFVLLRDDPWAKEKFSRIMDACFASGSGEPGLIFANDIETGWNPCLPPSVNLLTPEGIRTLGEVNEGDSIWNGSRWVTIQKKWSTGVKSVYRYSTPAGFIECTENHNLLVDGQRVKASDAVEIDVSLGVSTHSMLLDPQDIMDGLVLGDGSVHKASNDLVYLDIGQKDQDYFKSEINRLIGVKSGIGPYSWKVKTTLVSNEVPRTFDRKIPDRFFYGSSSKKLGFLKGIFSANGCVTAERIQYKGSSKILVEQLQIMLSSIGVRSSLVINKKRSTTHHNGIYVSKQSYNLIIYNDSVKFKNLIGGFLQEYKNEVLLRDRKTKNPSSPIRSVEYIRDEEVFDITVDGPEHWFWCNGLLISNCAEITLRDNGVCNLTELNWAALRYNRQFYATLHAAIALGCLQASYTDFGYVNPEWKRNADDEALLGVSITGQAEGWDELIATIDVPNFKETVDYLTDKWAKLVGINPPKRTLTTKPSGTTSALLGVTSGIHAAHSEFYIRRVRVDVSHPLAIHLAGLPEFKPFIELDKFNPSNYVISIPVQKVGAITRSQESAVGLMERMKKINEVWVSKGHYEGKDTHNVSLTVSYKPEEEAGIKEWMWNNRNVYCGISLLPYDGGTYVQAPFQEIDKETYERLAAEFPQIDLSGVNFGTTADERMGEAACQGGSCELV